MDWSKVTSWLVEAMGLRSKRAITRWVVGAKHLPSEVLALMDQRVLENGLKHGFTDKLFLESTYLVPVESKLTFKLPIEWAAAAATQLFQTMNRGVGVTAEQFETQFGRTMIFMGMYLQDKEKRVGIKAAVYPARATIKHDFLTNMDTRQMVNHAMEEKKQLEDVLPELKIVLEDFQKK